MTFSMTMDAAAYIFIALIVILIGLAIITGGDPVGLLEKHELSSDFEPGKIKVVRPLEGFDTLTELNCLGTTYQLSLIEPKFYSNELPPNDESHLDFVVVLNYDNLLFLGYAGGAPKLECNAMDDEWDCDQPKKLTFDLSSVGAPVGDQNFHFTIWESRASILGALGDSQMTLNKLLDSFPQFYISSFDSTINIEQKCDAFECGSKDNEDACNSVDGRCFWHDPIGALDKCELCPTTNDCVLLNDDQCRQCKFAQANCELEASSNPLDILNGFERCVWRSS